SRRLVRYAPSHSADELLPGARSADHAARPGDLTLEATTRAHLTSIYGARAREILDLTRADPSLAAPLCPAHRRSEAEVVPPAALISDEAAATRGSAAREIRQFYPASAHVEHDPEEIFATTVAAGREALTRAGLDSSEVAAIGITNQRETTVVWERATGRPIHPAVVWQSRASAAICERLRADGHERLVRERTGLVIDAYFSGTKVRWILDQVAGAQKR